jgi:metallo-beta-lactamase class B
MNPIACDSQRKLVMAAARLSALVMAFAGSLYAQNSPDWTAPFPPFRIAGNLYYVGSAGLANYLITTPQGHILINSDLEANVPLIRASVEELGFKFSDIRILLISHAHWDHDAGSAMIKQLTGATYMVMEQDVGVVESGGKTDFQYGGDASTLYPAVKVDRVLRDGDEVKLGDAVLVAHLTPGHTKGCTTWTLRVTEGGKTYNAVIIGSPNVNAGYKLVNNAAYPQIAQDFDRTFRVLKSLPVDLFLGAHGSYFGMGVKWARMKRGVADAFVDPAGYMKYVTQKEQEFRDELARQRSPVIKGAPFFTPGPAPSSPESRTTSTRPGRTPRPTR